MKYISMVFLPYGRMEIEICLMTISSNAVNNFEVSLHSVNRPCAVRSLWVFETPRLRFLVQR